MEAQQVFRTRWGWMGMAATQRGVGRIVLPQSSRQAVTAELQRQPWGKGPVALGALRRAQRQLARYLSGESRSVDFPVDLSQGSAFQRRVWLAAKRIPYGRARSYQWIAARVGGKRYARAVGTALGANPVPIIVPCHRVVAQDGSLGGFSGGLRNKRRLLDLEGTLAQLRRGRRVNGH